MACGHWDVKRCRVFPPVCFALAAMENKVIRNEISILRHARKSYLEFLRNITPQILLFSFVLFLGQKLDFTSFDISNFFQTAIFYVLVIALIIAFASNCTLLFESMYPNSEKWFRRNFLRSRRQSNSKTSAVLHVMKTLIIKKYLAVLEFILVFFFLQVCFAIVAVAGIRAAVSMVQLSGG